MEHLKMITIPDVILATASILSIARMLNSFLFV